MFGLGLDARLGGAPGRAGTAMSSCWAGKEAKHGAIGPLLSLRYITPDHAIIKMLEREQKKRAAEKRREEERAAGAQVKIFELTPDGRRLLVNAPSGAGRASPTLRSSSSTGQLLGLPAVEVPSGRRLELPPPRGRSRPASRSCCVSSSSVASFHSSASGKIPVHLPDKFEWIRQTHKRSPQQFKHLGQTSSHNLFDPGTGGAAASNNLDLARSSSADELARLGAAGAGAAAAAAGGGGATMASGSTTRARFSPFPPGTPTCSYSLATSQSPIDKDLYNFDRIASRLVF